MATPGTGLNIPPPSSLTNLVEQKLRAERVVWVGAGWFATIAFMKANKDLVVQSEARTIAVKPAIAAKIYDAQIAGFSLDGAWSPKAIDVIRHSLKELGILSAVPEAKAIYNDQFVPVKF